MNITTPTALETAERLVTVAQSDLDKARQTLVTVSATPGADSRYLHSVVSGLARCEGVLTARKVARNAIAEGRSPLEAVLLRAHYTASQASGAYDKDVLVGIRSVVDDLTA